MGATPWASADSRKFASWLPLKFGGIGFIDEWKTYASVEPSIVKNIEANGRDIYLGAIFNARSTIAIWSGTQ